MLRNPSLTEALHKFLSSLTDEEVTTAADNLLAYLEDVSALYDVLASDPARYDQFLKLTTAERGGTVEKVDVTNPTH